MIWLDSKAKIEPVRANELDIILIEPKAIVVEARLLQLLADFEVGSR